MTIKSGSQRGILYAMASVPLLLCLLAPAHAGRSPQNSPPDNKKDYALIFGTVWGPDSRPVAGVPIKIRRASDKKAKWELMSNHSGEFAQRVPVGEQDYVVQADIKTPKGQPKPEVTVHIEGNERKDIGLHLSEQIPTKQ